MCDADTPDHEDCLLVHWDYSLDMSTETMWDAFFLYGLLVDALEHQEALELPHNSQDQSTWIEVALQHSNMQMVGPGQEYWNHACNKCCKISEDEKSGEHQLHL